MSGTLGIAAGLLLKGAMYMSRKESLPCSKIYIWSSLVQVQSVVYSHILNAERELNSQLSVSPATHPFSWISLLREGLMLVNVSGLGKLSSCLLCAMLGHLPLVAGPSSFALNSTKGKSIKTSPIPEVELYWPFFKILLLFRLWKRKMHYYSDSIF